jgi:hypothetical protein
MSQRRPIALALALALAFVSALSACGTDVGKCGEQADLAAGVSTTATAGDVTPILAQNCALGGCHLSAPGAGNLVLDVSSGAASGSGWAGALVGVPAHESPSMRAIQTTAGSCTRSSVNSVVRCAPRRLAAAPRCRSARHCRRWIARQS